MTIEETNKESISRVEKICEMIDLAQFCSMNNGQPFIGSKITLFNIKNDFKKITLLATKLEEEIEKLSHHAITAILEADPKIWTCKMRIINSLTDELALQRNDMKDFEKNLFFHLEILWSN
jgi:hypothetical protein